MTNNLANSQTAKSEFKIGDTVVILVCYDGLHRTYDFPLGKIHSFVNTNDILVDFGRPISFLGNKHWSLFKEDEIAKMNIVE